MNNLEKFAHSNLHNLSNNLYSFLKNNSESKQIKISDSFDFDDYKESVRFELVQFSYNFIALFKLDSQESKKLILKKAKLKNYVDEILDNEDMLNNYTIYKIQQFINRVARNLLKSGYDNFEEVSKNEKYLKYKEIEIDVSNILGFISADKVISELYKQFNLKRLESYEYSEAFLLRNIDEINNNPDYVSEINKLLFKAAVDIDEKKHVVIKHPVKDDDTIIKYIEDGCVASRTPKRLKKRVIIDEMEEIPDKFLN